MAVERGWWCIDRERNAFFLDVAAKKKKTGLSVIEKLRVDLFHCAVKLVIGNDEVEIYAIKQVDKNEAGRTVWNIKSIVEPMKSSLPREVVEDMVREICKLTSRENVDVVINFPLPSIKTSHLDMAAVLLRNMMHTVRFSNRFQNAILLLFLLTLIVAKYFIIAGFILLGIGVILTFINMDRHGIWSSPAASPRAARYRKIGAFVKYRKPWINMPENKFRRKWLL
jgi:hypothetical protein